jgi:hypothetical protein
MPNKPKRTCKAGSNFATALEAHGISNAEMSDMMSCHCSTITGWRYRGVPAVHAQLAADFLHIKAATITSKSKRKGRPFTDKAITTTPADYPKTVITAPIQVAGPETITINGEVYVRQDDVNDAMEEMIDAVINAKRKFV